MSIVAKQEDIYNNSGTSYNKFTVIGDETGSVGLAKQSDMTAAQNAIGTLQSDVSGLQSSKSNTIKYKEVNLGTVTIGSDGYTSISSYMPSGMTNFLFCVLWSVGESTKKAAVSVHAKGDYILGTYNDSITSVVIRYFYTD